MKNFSLFLFILIFCATSLHAQKGKKTEKSYADKKYEQLTSKYEFSGPFCDGLARVRQNKKWGYIDTTGSVIIPLKYNEVENFSDDMARVRVGQKWGLLHKSGKVIIKPTFQQIGEFINGKAKVLLDGTEYYMNTEGIRVEK